MRIASFSFIIGVSLDSTGEVRNSPHMVLFFDLPIVDLLHLMPEENLGKSMFPADRHRLDRSYLTMPQVDHGIRMA